jgi:hypothetical protein
MFVGSYAGFALCHPNDPQAAIPHARFRRSGRSAFCKPTLPFGYIVVAYDGMGILSCDNDKQWTLFARDYDCNDTDIGDIITLYCINKKIMLKASIDRTALRPQHRRGFYRATGQILLPRQSTISISGSSVRHASPRRASRGRRARPSRSNRSRHPSHSLSGRRNRTNTSPGRSRRCHTSSNGGHHKDKGKPQQPVERQRRAELQRPAELLAELRDRDMGRRIAPVRALL